PLVGWVLRRAGQIPVVRGAGVEAMAAPACRALERGQTVLVYPEGTIPPPGHRPPARRGAGVLALRTSAPIIPVAMWGMEPRGRGLGRVPIRRPAAVVFGQALDLAAWRGRQEDEAAQHVSDLMLASVRDLLPRAQALAAGRVEDSA
ncbi:MAG: 1-acyl-sn-glycerol-3-phosphate acyltransferase, partial [Actinomycetota bacterium]|nr:1-acyl-sn-glycerol-3-phosphate acyltransferase [Actinomycetota bacterium]